MSAYGIVDIDVIDPAGYEDYKKLAPEAVEFYGGRYIARGGRTEILEGHRAPKRLVILEFPSSAQAQAWLISPEYAPAPELRHRYATANMVAIEGLR